jgi:hypothetical protein
MLLSEQCPDISEDRNFFMLKALDVPVIWTLDGDGLKCFEIQEVAHPVLWCCISAARIAKMQIV